MDRNEFDTEYFGKILMRSLLRIYESMDLALFAGKMYSLWNKLPRDIGRREPFLTLCYADDCLSYHDEEQCRKLYEKAMCYYEWAMHRASPMTAKNIGLREKIANFQSQVCVCAASTNLTCVKPRKWRGKRPRRNGVKYGLHMKVGRYVSDENGVPKGDEAFIKE